MFLRIYALVVTVALVGISILHFANPYPLIQIPDKGHRLYFVPDDRKQAVIKILGLGGLTPSVSFKAGGINQTLMSDGVTVIATGPVQESCGISLPVNLPYIKAAQAQLLLSQQNIRSSIENPPEPKFLGKLSILHVEGLQTNFAFRVTGRKMPTPDWQ